MAKWSRAGLGFRAENVEALMRAVSRIGTWKTGRSFVWRGVVDAEWDIASSLFRSLSSELGRRPLEAEMRYRELALLYEAREWGVGLELGEQATDLHMLAIMQHHGLPTRLIDVTHDPMTAMFFACEPRKDGDGRTGAMFAFDVRDYRRFKTIDSNATLTWEHAQYGAHTTLREALRHSRDNRSPVLVEPTLRDSRMAAQEGLFIASWTPDTPPINHIEDLAIPEFDPPGRTLLEEILGAEKRPRGMPNDLPFCAVLIPAAVKKRVLAHLDVTYNRNRSYLYPDLEGFKHELLDLKAVRYDRAGPEEAI